MFSVFQLISELGVSKPRLQPSCLQPIGELRVSDDGLRPIRELKVSNYINIINTLIDFSSLFSSVYPLNLSECF